MGSHYFKSDGNGGFLVGKITLGMLISIISLMSVFATLVISSTTVSNRLDYTENTLKSHIETQDKSVEAVAARMQDYEKNQAAILNELKNIKEQQKDMQYDIKQLLKKE
jgi:peptidoglycan hydrolase CwlO-like protein